MGVGHPMGYPPIQGSNKCVMSYTYIGYSIKQTFGNVHSWISTLIKGMCSSSTSGFLVVLIKLIVTSIGTQELVLFSITNYQICDIRHKCGIISSNLLRGINTL